MPRSRISTELWSRMTPNSVGIFRNVAYSRENQCFIAITRRVSKFPG